MGEQRIFDINDWLIDQLRCTFFIESLPNTNDFLSWEQLIGSPPDTSSYSPKLSKGEEFGQFEIGHLRLSYVPNRIDWLYIPFISSEEQLLDFPTLGSSNESLSVFIPLMEKWLESCQPINRMALGITIHRPSADHNEAYEFLNKLLQYVEVDGNTSDFKYQVNRKRKSQSGIEDLYINRLSSWQAIKLMIKIQKEDAGIRYACQTTLDVNTHQDYEDVLPQDKLKALLNELVEMSIEIAEKGDLP